MSGEARVILVAEAGSVPYRAIARLAELGPALAPFAVIGGLAVITRLGQAHRATNDVDTVSEGDPDYLPYLTHRFAFDTRTQVEVIVRPSNDDQIVATSVSVARASALIAIKLGISEGVGRQRDPRKVGSDAFDVARQVSRLAVRHLVDDVDRTAAAIVRSAVQGARPSNPSRSSSSDLPSSTDSRPTLGWSSVSRHTAATIPRESRGASGPHGRALSSSLAARAARTARRSAPPPRKPDQKARPDESAPRSRIRS